MSATDGLQDYTHYQSPHPLDKIETILESGETQAHLLNTVFKRVCAKGGVNPALPGYNVLVRLV